MALLKKKINNYCFVFDTMNKAIRPKFVAISQTEREREREQQFTNNAENIFPKTLQQFANYWINRRKNLH